MAHAIVSSVLEKLRSIISQEIEQAGQLATLVREEVEKLVRKEVENLSSDLQLIRGVLEDAEQRQVRERAVRRWVDKVKDLAYEMEDVLDECNTAMLKLKIERDHEDALFSKKHVCFSFASACFCFNGPVILRFHIYRKITKFNKRLQKIASERDRFHFSLIRSVQKTLQLPSTSLVDVSEIYGRDDEKINLIDKLFSESGTEERLQIICVLGMGSIGKTTLAKVVYNDVKVCSHFDERMWIWVSKFDVFNIARYISEALEGAAFSSNELEFYLRYISQSIVGKKFLLVLDDVQIEDYNRWEPLLNCLRNGFRGSKILITTRKESVARMIGSIEVITIKELSDEKCWSLFGQIAFYGRSLENREELTEIGKNIANKCKGLPLGIKIIAGVLRYKSTKEEWRSLLESEMWQQEEFGGIFSPLWLSYNDLPSVVRRCFLYCAIFPKDYKINKDKLIKLWTAQGYLGVKENEEVEAMGQEYFNQLVARSLFQEFEIDDKGIIIRCKMHAIVHDFVQFLAENECRKVTVSHNRYEGFTYSYHKCHHSMLTLNKGVSFPVSMCRANKFRSLFIQYGLTNCSSISEVLPMLFARSMSLRALDLSAQLLYENAIIVIPREIGKLILLKYLNLSSLKMVELPETLCELYNLQTLELSWCTNLNKLPQGMGKLMSLRHMVNDGTALSYIPKGIERLTCLRTFSEFVVSSSSGDDGGKACTLESLKNMNNLQGSLRIRKLGNVADVGEVEQAELQNKLKLLHLYLTFESDAEEIGLNNDEVVLQALKPHQNLESLEIRDYKGSTLSPTWMLSLSKLRILSLHDCNNCEHLPPLGKLPSLESLSIWSMGRVKSLGNEFLGIGSDGASSSSSVIPFPKLKSLKFVDMEEWEDWDSGITIMPCLSFLSLVHCPKLKAVPGHILQTEKLEELNINWCPILKKRYNRWTGEDWHNISGIPNITINFEYVKRDRL